MPGNIGTDAMASQAECHLRHLPNSYDGEGIGPLDLDTPSKEAYEAEEEIPLVDHDDDFGVVVPRTHPRARQLPVWLRYPRNIFRALIPSFLKASDPNAVQKPLHPTAWLDGLRGVAAFFVVCHHWSLVTANMNIHRGFMSDDDPMFIQLPIIRLVISGFWSVCVFFVISGFALSYKPLKLLGQHKTAEFATAAASSAFRRHIRLFLPPAMTTFVIAWISYFGWFEIPTSGVAVPALRPPRFDRAYDQLWDWAMNLIGLSDPFGRNLRRGEGYPYEPTLWTIPIEFDCSLVIFLAHVAFSRLRTRVRLGMNLFLVAYTLYFNYWQYFLFLAGLLCANLHFYWQPAIANNTLPYVAAAATPGPHGRFARLSFSLTSSPTYSVTKKMLGTLSFLGALWLLSYPKGTGTAGLSPGYKTLVAITPERYGEGEYLWIPLASAWLVLSVDRSPFLQPLFTNRLIQYFGRISYALYLVHGSLLWLYGWHLVRFFTGLTGAETSGQFTFGVLLATCFFMPGVVCVADFAQRYLDANAVKFAAWFEGKLIDKRR
ncbi:acyltransferase [Colletotrichum costaricense]|uniref:Acyltransferase n=2 Tax=Colletotrichum acutatum species complex TaxID=2707335 RepID=A0AAJ0DUY3_9PEZI|nr:acyltransferase [Colletotrichum costaricense]XP_060388978.1 acyltransferase [Colletotrichum tamarilloi]KAK1512904.1 acyltransferase [Colletotrichum tamarilloi]KAK1514367.1 acyltransferase [Colletotrichum costaricense]